jgi:hypothetical protein
VPNGIQWFRTVAAESGRCDICPGFIQLNEPIFVHFLVNPDIQGVISQHVVHEGCLIQYIANCNYDFSLCPICNVNFEDEDLSAGALQEGDGAAAETVYKDIASAAEHGALNQVKAFIERGIGYDDQVFALQYASQGNDSDENTLGIIEVLLSVGAIRDDDRMTLLQNAAQNGSIAILEILTQGITVQKREKENFIQCAQTRGYGEKVREFFNPTKSERKRPRTED